MCGASWWRSWDSFCNVSSVMKRSEPQFFVGKNSRCRFFLWHSYSHGSKDIVDKDISLPTFSWQYSLALEHTVKSTMSGHLYLVTILMIGINILVTANKWKCLFPLQVRKLSFLMEKLRRAPSISISINNNKNIHMFIFYKLCSKF